MRTDTYRLLQNLITDEGFGDDVTWAETIGACPSPDDFAREHAFVVCNSGMRAKTACGIFQKVQKALAEGRPLAEVFGHEHKCYSIQHVYDRRQELFVRYREVDARDMTETKEEVIAFLRTLPHIGNITKFHLVKNLGQNVCKPDRHLVRIAAFYETTPHDLCKALSVATGLRIATIDTVICRAASLSIIKFLRDTGTPLIPTWSEADSINISCPSCAASQEVKITFPRKHAMSSWPEECKRCSNYFSLEPEATGISVRPIEPYVEAQPSASQLSLLDSL